MHNLQDCELLMIKGEDEIGSSVLEAKRQVLKFELVEIYNLKREKKKRTLS